MYVFFVVVGKLIFQFESDLISRKKTNTDFSVIITVVGVTHQAPDEITPTRADKSGGCVASPRARADASLDFLCWRPHVRKPLRPGSRGWAERASKRGARSSDGDKYIPVSNSSL